MINTIIDLINDGLGGIVENQIVIGVTQRVYRSSNSAENEIDFMPGVVKDDGDAIYAGIDDVASLMIYHKTNAATLSFNQKNGYGDSRQNEDTVSCNLIAVWDTRKIPVQATDMLLLLRSRLPQGVRDVPNIKDVVITPTGALLNTKQIFDSEYSIGSKGYLLPMFINFLQLNYTILLRYDQQCIDKCIICSN